MSAQRTRLEHCRDAVELAEEVAHILATPSGKAPRKSRAGWSLCCPAHEDRSPSVSVKPADRTDGVVVRCGAGCSTESVLGAVGLTTGDLFVKREGTGNLQVPARRKPAQVQAPDGLDRDIQASRDLWLDYFTGGDILQDCEHNPWSVHGLERLHDHGHIAGPTPRGPRDNRLRLVYHGANGRPIGYGDRGRKPGGKVIAGDGSKRNLWPHPEALPPDASHIVIVEGEADAIALWSHGIYAVAIPGTGAWKSPKPEYAARFSAVDRVILLADADDAGRKLMAGVYRDLRAAGVVCEYRETFPGADDGSDVSDLLRATAERITDLDGLLAILPTPTIPEGLDNLEAEQAETQDDNGEPDAFPLWTFGDLAERPEPEPLIHGVITAGDVFGIVAPFSSGKSAIALDMALRIAAGLPWQGRHVVQGAVVYVAAENVPGYVKRMEAWGRENGVDVSTLPFRLIDAPMKLNGTNLDDVRLRKSVEQATTDMGQPVRLTILDTVRRTLAGKENESEVFQAYVDACDRLKNATGSAVGAVHHSPKNEENPGGRGSGVWNDALAPILALKAKGDPDALTVEVSCDAKRGGKPPKDIEPFAPFTFHLAGVDLGRVDKYGERVTGVVAKAGEHPRGTQTDQDRYTKLVLDAVAEEGPQSRQALISVQGRNRQASSDLIRDLLESGRLVVVDRRGKAELFGLPVDQPTLND